MPEGERDGYHTESCVTAWPRGSMFKGEGVQSYALENPLTDERRWVFIE